MSQMIPEDIIRQVQEASDIVGLVSGYLVLRKTGQNAVGLCPFHSEKTGSFTVNASKQIFHCFGCGAGGNVFKFLMLKEGMTFPESVRELGRQAGITVPASGENSAEDPDEDLIGINESAKTFFHESLLKGPAGDKAREYLKSRGISREMIEAFQIGYAPPGWTHCSQFLEKKGHRISRIEKAGLALRNQSGEGFHERFRDRLIFPVHNAHGQCVAFGGRLLGQEGGPKYLNSPETPVYNKGKILFAFDRARKEKTGSIVVVEGYFDAVRAHQAGFRNVVATCGTALTAGHLQQIRRTAERVYLIFDPDPAGVRAALRTADLFFGTGFPVRVVVLPEALDPDLYIARYGREGFEGCLEKAVPLFDFVLGESLKKNPQTGLEGKLAVLKELLPLVSRTGPGVERSHYLARLSRELFVSETDIQNELDRFEKIAPKPTRVQVKNRTEEVREKLPLAEEYVLRFLLAGKITPGQILRYLSPEDFIDPRARRLVKQMRDDFPLENPLDGGWVVTRCAGDPPVEELLVSIYMKEPDYDFPIQALEESVEKLLKRKNELQKSELEQIISKAESEKDFEKAQANNRRLFDVKIREGTGERVKF